MIQFEFYAPTNLCLDYTVRIYVQTLLQEWNASLFGLGNNHIAILTVCYAYFIIINKVYVFFLEVQSLIRLFGIYNGKVIDRAVLCTGDDIIRTIHAFVIDLLGC